MLLFLVARFCRSTIIVRFTLYFVTTYVGISRVSSVTRWTRTEWLVIDGLTGSSLGTKSKFAWIFAFVASAQGIQNTS